MARLVPVWLSGKCAIAAAPEGAGGAKVLPWGAAGAARGSMVWRGEPE